MVLLDSATPEQFMLPAYPGAYSAFRRFSALLPPLSRLGLARLTLTAGFSSLPAPPRSQEQAFVSTARELASQRDEWSQLPTTFNQGKALHTLGTKPLIVITAGRDAAAGWFAAQDKLAALSSNNTHRTLIDSDHDALLKDQTAAPTSSQAICDVVQAIRTGTALQQR